MIEIILNNKLIFCEGSDTALSIIKARVSQCLDIKTEEFYILSNGKICSEDNTLVNCTAHVVPRIFGGKGGFGSMLRAIGAQIEKTTNREACRDLSGRRLRDINEEKRLKTWIAQQADREKEAADKKKKKLEKLCQEPKFEFKDEHYDKERSELPEKIEDAVLKGLQVATTSGIKRKAIGNGPTNKKRKLWVDGDLEDLSLSDDSEDSDSELQEVVVSKSAENSVASSESSSSSFNSQNEKR